MRGATRQANPPEGIHTLSGAYAVDALDAAERAEFERHLAGCADCREEVAGLLEVVATLSATTAAAPPPDLRARTIRSIRSVRPLPPGPAQHDRDVDELAHRRRRRLRGALAAAAAVVVVAGGITTVATHPWEHHTVQLSVADRVLRAADAQHFTAPLPGGAKATLTRSVALGRAVIVTSGMAPAPRGKVYELWLQNRRGTMHPAGLMAGGDTTTVLHGDAATSTAAAITVEDGQVAQPTTPPIALFSFKAAT